MEAGGRFKVAVSKKDTGGLQKHFEDGNVFVLKGCALRSSSLLNVGNIWWPDKKGYQGTTGHMRQRKLVLC